jgi:hypothetical protein
MVLWRRPETLTDDPMTRIGSLLWQLTTRAVVLVGVLCGTGCLVATDVTLPDLVGEWSTSEAQIADPANLNERVDVVALGWEITLSIASDGAFTLVIQVPGEDPDVRTGTLTVENGKDLILTRADGTVGEGEVFLEHDQVAFMFDEFAGLTADLYGNGTRIPVTLLLVMVRP